MKLLLPIKKHPLSLGKISAFKFIYNYRIHNLANFKAKYELLNSVIKSIFGSCLYTQVFMSIKFYYFIYLI